LDRTNHLWLAEGMSYAPLLQSELIGVDAFRDIKSQQNFEAHVCPV
jgi:hypothetical protein